MKYKGTYSGKGQSKYGKIYNEKSTYDNTVVQCYARGLLPVSPDVDFHLRPNKNGKMEGAANPHHPETVGKFRKERWTSQPLDAPVKVADVYPAQHVNDCEREESCGGSCEFKRVGMHMSKTY